MCQCSNCGRVATRKAQELGFCTKCGKPFDEDAGFVGFVERFLGYDADKIQQKAEEEKDALCIHYLQEVEGIDVSLTEARILSPFVWQG